MATAHDLRGCSCNGRKCGGMGCLTTTAIGAEAMTNEADKPSVERLMDELEYAVLARSQGHGSNARIKECRERLASAAAPAEQPATPLREVLSDADRKLMEQALAALGEVEDLIGESQGVYGLHLNGDVSPWGELIEGGRFERLTSLDRAIAALRSRLDGDKT